jgi:excinuclease UvrABC nuclease subunit
MKKMGKKIYYLLQEEDVVYVGQTNNLTARIRAHIQERKIKFDDVYYFICSPFKDENKVERELIKKYNPACNIAHNS